MTYSSLLIPCVTFLALENAKKHFTAAIFVGTKHELQYTINRTFIKWQLPRRETWFVP